MHPCRWELADRHGQAAQVVVVSVRHDDMVDRVLSARQQRVETRQTLWPVVFGINARIQQNAGAVDLQVVTTGSYRFS